jgi:hypothetical protein
MGRRKMSDVEKVCAKLKRLEVEIDRLKKILAEKEAEVRPSATECAPDCTCSKCANKE